MAAVVLKYNMVVQRAVGVLVKVMEVVVVVVL